MGCVFVWVLIKAMCHMRAVQMCVCFVIYNSEVHSQRLYLHQRATGGWVGGVSCVCISYANIFWAIAAWSSLLSSMKACKCSHDAQQKTLFIDLTIFFSMLKLSVLQDHLYRTVKYFYLTLLVVACCYDLLVEVILLLASEIMLFSALNPSNSGIKAKSF